MNPLVKDHVIVNGNRIAYGIYGEGTPVVLMHGTPSSSYIWRHVAPQLAEAGYRVYLYDLLGFGLSERPWDPAVDTSVTGQVPVLEGLLDHWGLTDFHLVAHDIGGAVALRLALLAGRMPRSLTLLDIVSYDSWPSPRTRQQMHEGLEKLITASDADHRAHFHDWLSSAVHDKAAFAEGAQAYFLELISNPIGQASLFQHQIRHYDPTHTQEVVPHLDRLGEIPVQILWGQNDEWQMVDWAHRLHGDIPGSALKILEGCGHFLMEDRPEEVTGYLLDFIGREN
ncbi:alpha/beta fold hydrolase [Aestuariispira insulae]|uniref:Pimeloyl-ACP methyl ester carboxylesterase n=1 Tax=Aestuariispira insulae TaxID=1461337 RepID=A0A3D9HE60_9PROT|nr:alpha/beta hydrolase [Aestuariispira insulae]RED47759.1 pimeloyl-ACP methyl ester carboxylesterase [Aestuariispira insulae]